MKLFWKDQLPLILLSLLQLILVIGVFWLDGEGDAAMTAYALLLGVVVFACALAYRYFSHRKFYRLLQNGQPLLEESVQQLGTTSLSRAMEELLENQYRHYQSQIIENDRKRQQHTTFMNLWVHQMKTPLSVLELMLQDSGDPRDESMREETERIRKGLDMALYMARLETFEQDFQVENLRLRAIVNEVIMENRRLFIRSFVYPEMLISEELTVETDGKWLRFIVQQLISNAVKFAAGTRTKVTLQAYTQGRAVVLEVRDAGAGIPSSDLSRVFQPFFTGENGRVFKESTGMGLYIVKSILDKMNHNITIESSVGEGTTVRVVFPFAARETSGESDVWGH